MRTLATLVVLLCVLFAVASAHNINKKSLRCAACGFFVSQITEQTAGLTKPEEIRSAVNGVCTSIPNEHFKAQCARFMTKRGDAIVKKLVKGESLENVCHCKNKLPVEVGTKYCAICQFLVSELENATRNNEPAVIKVLERACNVLPVSYRTTCDAVVETFGPMLIEKFLQMETPDKVCHQVHLCDAAKAPAPTPAAPTAQNGLECEFCKLVLSYVEKHLTDPKNQAAVEHVLQNICKVMPKQMESSCEALITTYYPVLISYITQDLPPEVICQKIKLCTSSKLMAVTPATTTTAPSTNPKGNELECVVCKYLMKVLENFITGNETEEQLEKLFHKACTYLPHSLEGQCNSLVDAFGPQLAAWIIQNGVKQLDQFCVSVGICSKQVVAVQANIKCPICEYIVAFLEERLKGDVTQKRIESLLEEVCHHMPLAIQSQCTALVDAYTPVIINWFLNKEPADKLCAQIKLCSSSQLVQTSSKPGQYCAICQFVMEYLEEFIAKDATEAKIIAAVEKVCDFFPKSIAPTCKAFIEANGAQIIQALLNKENPQVVCKQIHACTSTKDKPAEASFMCPACEFVMVQLEQFLSQNRTQQEIIDFLNHVCDLIPGDLKSMCTVLIDLELPNIISWLQSLPPDQICAAIGACKRQAMMPSLISNIKLTRRN